MSDAFNDDVWFVYESYKKKKECFGC